MTFLKKIEWVRGLEILTCFVIIINTIHHW